MTVQSDISVTFKGDIWYDDDFYEKACEILKYLGIKKITKSSIDGKPIIMTNNQLLIDSIKSFFDMNYVSTIPEYQNHDIFIFKCIRFNNKDFLKYKSIIRKEKLNKINNDHN